MSKENGIWHNRWNNRNRESIERLMDFKHADTPAYDTHIAEREAMLKPNGAGVRAAQAREDAIANTLMENSVERVQNERTMELLTEMIYRIEVLEEKCEQIQELIEQY